MSYLQDIQAAARSRTLKVQTSDLNQSGGPRGNQVASYRIANALANAASGTLNH